MFRRSLGAVRWFLSVNRLRSGSVRSVLHRDTSAAPSTSEVAPASALNRARQAPTSGQSSPVFDVAEVVELLKAENLTDICCIHMPSDVPIAQYMVLCSATNPRHLIASCQLIYKAYKAKMSPGQPMARLEGDRSDDWKVIDMNNIIVHVMMPVARQFYDIEMLWAVGLQYDELTTAKTEIELLLEGTAESLEHDIWRLQQCKSPGQHETTS